MASSASAGAAAITRMVSRRAFFKAGVRTVLAPDTRQKSIEASVDRRTWGRDPRDRRQAGQPAGAPRCDSLALRPAFFQGLAGADQNTTPLRCHRVCLGARPALSPNSPFPIGSTLFGVAAGRTGAPIPARATTNRDVIGIHASPVRTSASRSRPQG